MLPHLHHISSSSQELTSSQLENMGPFMGFRPMRHIDRKDLYTNLEARIQYLHTFLDFGSSE